MRKVETIIFVLVLTIASTSHSQIEEQLYDIDLNVLEKIEKQFSSNNLEYDIEKIHPYRFSINCAFPEYFKISDQSKTDNYSIYRLKTKLFEDYGINPKSVKKKKKEFRSKSKIKNRELVKYTNVDIHGTKSFYTIKKTPLKVLNVESKYFNSSTVFMSNSYKETEYDEYQGYRFRIVKKEENRIYNYLDQWYDKEPNFEIDLDINLRVIYTFDSEFRVISRDEFKDLNQFRLTEYEYDSNDNLVKLKTNNLEGDTIVRVYEYDGNLPILLRESVNTAERISNEQVYPIKYNSSIYENRYLKVVQTVQKDEPIIVTIFFDFDGQWIIKSREGDGFRNEVFYWEDN